VAARPPEGQRGVLLPLDPVEEVEQPYIFKLANRINDDIERIEEMIQFEKKNNADLSDYIDNIE
jgi:hypothetical protein